MSTSNCISFYVNGKLYSMQDADPTLSFNSWLLSQPGLTGTKVMCSEGGCGSCIVALQRPSESIKAVNSCLLPLCSVDGCHVTTVEGIGSQRTGFNKIQSQIAEMNGSQCGYCTPGFVMSMYSLLEVDKSPCQQKVEDNFDGNICRCTGYRSILDAMKCFACDADQIIKMKCKDIEDLLPCYHRLNQNRPNAKVHLRYLKINNDLSTWIRHCTFDELIKELRSERTKNNMYKLVCGNTGGALYEYAPTHSLCIDISLIREFRIITNHEKSIEFGAAVTISEMIKTLSERSEDSVTFGPIINQLNKMGNKPVRNCGSWAGNLMLKHDHNEFPSDISIVLEVSNARIKVVDADSSKSSNHSVYGKTGLINLDMDGKVIVSVTIPKITDDGKCKMKSFKVMPRSQNAYSYVNAAFRVELNDTKTEINKAVLVFGGIHPSFDHATKTEEYLVGKTINSNDTLQGSMTVLLREISGYLKKKYKLNLALGLFYKFYLSLCDTNELASGIRSGVTSLMRPVSKGSQTFKSDPTTFPLSENIPHQSGKLQASGEAQYLSDRSTTDNELHCTFVTSNIANADIDTIDASEAELMPGFVEIITRDNFPSEVRNTFLYRKDPSRPIIAIDHVDYAGQAIAIVIAENGVQASRIADVVKVTYKNIKKPILTTKDAIEQNSFYDLHIPPFELGKPDEAIQKSEHTVTGEIDLGLQYHFYMETQICRAECTEEGGFNIEVATQGQQMIQKALSYAFGVSANKLEISTKRVGGAFGGKSTNATMVASAAVLASYVTRQPVRFHANLKICMSTLGSRTPYAIKYKLGFNDDGMMNGVDCTIYGNLGCSSIDGELDDETYLLNYVDSAYYCPNRRYKKIQCKTNIPSTTWCRAPGSLQMTAAADLMIEHIASYLGKDPISVKMDNLYKHDQSTVLGEPLLYCNLRGVYQQLLDKYEIRKRQNSIELFNQANKWKKKGLAVTPMKFWLELSDKKLTSLVTIYAKDGSVVVSHGGIEFGQGINTKVAQAAACELGIPLELIMVQRTSTLTCSNSTLTAGSTTSEVACQSVLACCKILKSRIEPIKAQMGDDVKWKHLISKCYAEHIDLTASQMNPPAPNPGYFTFGVTAAEVEYDVLTGERQILKVDTIFDCGISINPSIDIGQVEGAFVMGIGFWLTERMVYDEDNGQLLTWKNMQPVSKDIPIEWNIELLQDAPNPIGILRSKSAGEPPICMSVCVALALKRAVEATRRDRGLSNYFTLPTPATVDALHNSSILNPLRDFTLQ